MCELYASQLSLFSFESSSKRRTLTTALFRMYIFEVAAFRSQHWKRVRAKERASQHCFPIIFYTYIIPLQCKASAPLTTVSPTSVCIILLLYMYVFYLEAMYNFNVLAAAPEAPCIIVNKHAYTRCICMGAPLMNNVRVCVVCGLTASVSV